MALLSAVLLLSSLLLRATRWITLLLIFPFLLAWGFWFSYEIRNASLAFPLVALVSGIVIDWVFVRIAKPLDNMAFGPATVGGLAAVIAVLSLSGWVLMGKPGADLLPEAVIRFESSEWIADALELYSSGIGRFRVDRAALDHRHHSGRKVGDPLAGCRRGLARFGGSAAMGKYRADPLVASQRMLERRIGIPAVNEQIYAAVRARSIHQPIMTDYWYLGYPSRPGVAIPRPSLRRALFL